MEAKIAQELDPLNPIIMNRLGYVYYFSRQYDLAIQEFNNCLEIDPDQMSSYRVLYYTFCMKGMYDEAIKTLEKRLIILEKDDIAAIIRKTFEESGFTKAIRQLLDVSMDQSIGFGNNPHNKSMLFASIGDIDEAFEWLEKAYERRRSVLNALQVNPIYDSLRSDPRFQDLLERIHYPD